jgi:hypothetical protein
MTNIILNQRNSLTNSMNYTSGFASKNLSQTT